jgi:hypothetical protein
MNGRVLMLTPQWWRVLTLIIKHSKKICSVFGGHLKSINFPPKKWEGYYAYSSIVGGFLHP